ncbi:MAG: IS30 family transposase [Anaerolineaceae bacterium]|nr:IS30 family transposase [Anaerolineaceae bacterium]
MPYKQLTYVQRYQIKSLLKMGHRQNQIAECLCVHKSTISREIRRNQGLRGYRPKQAHELAMSRRNKARKRITASTWKMVEERIQEEWSPEQISGRLKKEGIQISHEHIYQHIYANKRIGGNLWNHLRCQKKRRKRAGNNDRRGKIADRVSIEERPAVVDTRSRLGDWEVDLIIGKGHQGVMVTLTDRKSRFTLLRKAISKQADLVADTVIDLLRGCNHLETMTADNGKEFASHKLISQNLNLDVYFAHPYSSWERGTNENTNGLIRQYLPKSRNLKSVTTMEEIQIMDRLNLRPRKCLDFLTPFEVFFKEQFCCT